jgi:DNA-binding NarL/FixJ family response regulator
MIPSEMLSRREQEVLYLMVRGEIFEEIGKRLCIATSTVDNYNKRICTKLGLERDGTRRDIRFQMLRWYVTAIVGSDGYEAIIDELRPEGVEKF